MDGVSCIHDFLFPSSTGTVMIVFYTNMKDKKKILPTLYQSLVCKYCMHSLYGQFI